MESLQQNKTENSGIIWAYIFSYFLFGIFLFNAIMLTSDRLSWEKAIEIHEYALWGGFCFLLFVLIVKLAFRYKKEKSIMGDLAFGLFCVGSLYLTHALLSFLSKNFLEINFAHVSLILALVFGVVTFCIRHEFFTARIILKSEYAALAATDAEVEQARAEAAALREENAALKAALEQARQERKAQGGESLTPQQKAAQVRSENTLAAWKPKIGAMVKVAVQIGKEGPKERQAGDFYAYFNELDVDLRACLETHLSIMKRFNSMLAMAI